MVELNLFQVPISNLSSRIKSLNQLEFLDLRLTKVTELPIEIGELKHMTKFECSKLSKSLPSSFCKLTSLKEFDVSFENIENPFPEEFGELKSLECLTTSSRGLNQLPASFGKLDNLKRLDLTYAKFKEFPLVLAELKNLDNLGLRDNAFTAVPDELATMKSLRLVYFNNNPIGNSAAMKKKCAALLPGVYFSF